jgi:hypothetical protein
MAVLLSLPIQTNTRAMTGEKASERVKEICSNLKVACGGTPCMVVLRQGPAISHAP